jgi:hypothetical protein
MGRNHTLGNPWIPLEIDVKDWLLELEKLDAEAFQGWPPTGHRVAEYSRSPCISMKYALATPFPHSDSECVKSLVKFL